MGSSQPELLSCSLAFPCLRCQKRVVVVSHTDAKARFLSMFQPTKFCLFSFSDSFPFLVSLLRPWFYVTVQQSVSWLQPDFISLPFTSLVTCWRERLFSAVLFLFVFFSYYPPLFLLRYVLLYIILNWLICPKS